MKSWQKLQTLRYSPEQIERKVQYPMIQQIKLISSTLSKTAQRTRDSKACSMHRPRSWSYYRTGPIPPTVSADETPLDPTPKWSSGANKVSSDDLRIAKAGDRQAIQFENGRARDPIQAKQQGFSIIIIWHASQLVRDTHVRVIGKVFKKISLFFLFLDFRIFYRFFVCILICSRTFRSFWQHHSRTDGV